MEWDESVNELKLNFFFLLNVLKPGTQNTLEQHKIPQTRLVVGLGIWLVVSISSGVRGCFGCLLDSVN